MNRPAGNGCPGCRPGLPAAPSRGIKEPRRVAAHRRRKPLEPRMTEIVLHAIDQVLVDRIKRVAGTRAWTVPRTLLHLLEQGLHVYEGDGSLHLDTSESDVHGEALAPMQELRPENRRVGTESVSRITCRRAWVRKKK